MFRKIVLRIPFSALKQSALKWDDFNDAFYGKNKDIEHFT